MGLMQASNGITDLPELLYRAIDNTIIPATITMPEPQYANTAFPIISLNNSIPHIPAIKIPHWNLKHKQAYKVVAHISCTTLLKQLKESCNTNKHKVAQIHSPTLLKQLKETCNTNKHKVAQIHSTTLLKELKETCNLSVKKIGNIIACF
jgi:hypothetical protein